MEKPGATPFLSDVILEERRTRRRAVYRLDRGQRSAAAGVDEDDVEGVFVTLRLGGQDISSNSLRSNAGLPIGSVLRLSKIERLDTESSAAHAKDVIQILAFETR